MPCLRNPSSVLSCWMLSLVAALPLKIITKALKQWNFPSLLTGDQGEPYVPTCRITGSASLLSVYTQCVEVGCYLVFSRGNEPVLWGEERLGWCFCKSSWVRVTAFDLGSSRKCSVWYSSFVRQKFIVPKLFLSFSIFEILLNWEKKIVLSFSTHSFQNLRHRVWSNILAN